MSPSAIPDAQQLRTTLDTWDTWLEARTDRLLSLEERCRLAASPADQADVAAAFVARKAIAERLTAVSARAGKDREGATSLLGQPLVDGMGATVGSDVDDAATLLDAIIDAVGRRLAGAELRQEIDAEQIAAIEADLTVAERLAAALGEQVNSVAQLRQQQAARRDQPGLAAAAARLRSSLDAADQDRQRLLAAWARNEERLQRLTEREAQVRELATRCREKVRAAPVLAVPSVQAVGAAPAAERIASLPWAAARVELSPYVTKLDRVERALDEAGRRFQAALDERDDLRGLLQGYRSKAGAHGYAEDAELEPLYRRAETLLWSAPCDVATARPLVQQYVAEVNRRTGSGPTGPGRAGSGRSGPEELR